MLSKRKIRATFRRYAASQSFELEEAPLQAPRLALVPITDTDIDQLDGFISAVQTAASTAVIETFPR